MDADNLLKVEIIEFLRGNSAVVEELQPGVITMELYGKKNTLTINEDPATDMKTFKNWFNQNYRFEL